MLTLHTRSYTHKGRREANEDAIYPKKDNGGNLFLVCDGVGGCDNGQYASNKAIDFFQKQHNKLKKPSEQNILEIIYNLQLHFYEQKTENTSLGDMATTIAGISFSDNRAILFWAGDTHIYHFSEGLIKTESKDHSYVNKLIDSKIITTEEALKHPNRKAIVRAINGNEEITTDVIRVSKINLGDYFLIASDGVLEAISREDLNAYFNPKNNFNEVYHKIKSDCLEHSHDNFSFYLIKVINLG